MTPDISAEPGRSRDTLAGGEEEVTNAASFLIREWVEKLLGVKFDNLPDLAVHLLEKMYVDNRSVAAFTLVSRAAGKLDVKAGCVSGQLSPTSAAAPPNGTDCKLQLQRKLQEANMGQLKQADQHKRKMSDQELLIGKRSKVGDGLPDQLLPDTYVTPEALSFEVGGVAVPEPKLCDNQNRFSVVVQNSQTSQIADPVFINGNGAISFEPAAAGPGPVAATAEFQVSYNGDRLEAGRGAGQGQVQSTSSISLDKLPRKKQVVLVGSQVGDLAGVATNGLPVTSVIKAGEKPRNKYKETAEAVGAWPGQVGGAPELAAASYDTEPADLSGVRVSNWSGGSSDQHDTETELVQYFQQQPDSASDQDNHEKLSQLRQLLAKNLNPAPGSGQLSQGGAFKRTSLPLREGGAGAGPAKLETVISSGQVAGAAEVAPVQSPGMSQGQLSTRRRVSFHPLIVSDSDPVSGGGAATVAVAANCPIPPSPGTRRRHFSFQPISPRACQAGPGAGSPPASPFISPRSTPVHMLRSRHSSGSALPLHLLPGSGGRQQHPSGSGSDISRAATFGSASESSTPFISPMGTPIPFIRCVPDVSPLPSTNRCVARSRHNSASGRLCRSRHSSGVPLERSFSRQYSGSSVAAYSGIED